MKLYVVLLEGQLVGVFNCEKKLDKFVNGNDYDFDVEEIYLNQPYEEPYKLEWKPNN